jgi:hypothetical protein
MAGQHSNSSSSSSSNTTTVTLEKKRSLSPESTEEVRVVPMSEFEGAAECLSEAFAVDEVARYFVDTDDMARYPEEVRYKLHCDIIRYITAAHCLKGLVTTIGPDFDAVALWYDISFLFLFVVSYFFCVVPLSSSLRLVIFQHRQYLSRIK